MHVTFLCSGFLCTAAILLSFAVPQPALADTLWLEGESGVDAGGLTTVEIDATAGASANAYRLFPETLPATPPALGSGIVYSVNLGNAAPVMAEVWLRVRGSLDAGSLFHDLATGAWSTTFVGLDPNRWRWRRIGSTTLDPGSNAVVLAPATADIQVDALFFTTVDPVSGAIRPHAQSLAFSGDVANSDQVLIDTSAAPADPFDLSATSFSIEAWVYIPAGAGVHKWQALVTKGSDWGIHRYDGTRRIAFRTGKSDLVSATALAPDTWHHVAAVYDRNAGTKTIFIDGLEDAAASYSGTIPHGGWDLAIGTQDPASIRADDPAQNRFFEGRLDDLRIWTIARLPAEIAEHRRHMLRGSEIGLRGYWPFDGFGETAILDHGPGGWDGTMLFKAGSLAPQRATGVSLLAPRGGDLALGFTGMPGDTLSAPFSEPHPPMAESAFDFSGEFALEGWFQVESVPAASATLLRKGTGATAFSLSLDPAGKLVFDTPGLEDPALAANPSQLVSTNDVIGTLGTRSWIHVAAILRNAGPDHAPVFRRLLLVRNFDGSQRLRDESGDLTGALTSNNDALVLGDGFHGRLDEVRVWNRALSEERLELQALRRLNGSEPGLVAVWNVDDVIGLVPNRGLNGPAPELLDSGLGGSLTDASFVSGIPSQAPLPPQYAFNFNGTNEYIEVAHADSLNMGDSLTIEAWVHPLISGPLPILGKGDGGYGIGLDEDLHLIYSSGLRSVASTHPVERGAWSHVAVTVDVTADRVLFYINGMPAGEAIGADITNNSDAFVIGREGTVVSRYFYGGLDEIRLWNSVRTPAEISIFALQPLPTSLGNGPNLAGWWNFDDPNPVRTVGQSSHAHEGSIVNGDINNYIFGPEFGPSTGLEGLNFSRNPEAAGLWIGFVELDQVSEIGAIGRPLTPTEDKARFRILVHADSGGNLRLLKDITFMRREVDDGEGGTLTEEVLVTDPAIIPGLTGITERRGRKVGVRFGSVAYDFDGFDHFMVGGLGAGIACTTNLVLPADHPTNPYRHKFHPQHGQGFPISRQLLLAFDGDDGDPLTSAPGYGVERLAGTYTETITGLHKVPITMRGSIELNRISTKATLNE